MVGWLVSWSVLDFNSIYALDQNAVRCVGLVFGRCSRVFGVCRLVESVMQVGRWLGVRSCHLPYIWLLLLLQS